MKPAAVEVDEIVSTLVSEAEAYVLAERHQQLLEGTAPADSANATSHEASCEKGPVDAYPVSPVIGPASGASAIEGQQPLSATVSPEPVSSHTSSSVVASAHPSSNGVAQQQLSELQQPREVDASLAQAPLGKVDVLESAAKNSKLLALKQRRLGSLNSSLDLSRESSFDSALRQPLDDAASTLQNSFAAPVAHDSSSAMQADTELNEQASISLAPLPLDSTTGTEVISCACACTNTRSSLCIIACLSKWQAVVTTVCHDIQWHQSSVSIMSCNACP